ncbi:MAG: acyltransferase [Betaproteobacteria bacterium]|nr:acyltransferase [Betaproteobacteria bacterium]
MPTTLNPIYYFALLVFLLAFAGTSFFRGADASWHTSTSRTINLDGLRGLLVISVFIHHAAIYHGYLLHRVWQVPPSTLMTQAGQASVMFFFMITGFLFWSKAVTSLGRLNWRILYINRYFRIAPLYYFATLLMLLIVLGVSDFHLRESFLTLVKEVLPLGLAGFYSADAPINAYRSPSLILAGVTWTLRFEWLFYLLILPVSTFFARRKNWHLRYTSLGFLGFTLLSAYQPGMRLIALMTFFGGMLCASIQSRFRFVMPARWNTTLSVIICALLWYLMQFKTAYQTTAIGILWLIFLIITSGCSIFGLLTARPALRLGELSYSIYMLQGLLLYAAFYFSAISTYALNSAIQYWLVITVTGAMLLAVSLATHLLIEKPGILLGKNLSGRFK